MQGKWGKIGNKGEMGKIGNKGETVSALIHVVVHQVFLMADLGRKQTLYRYILKPDFTCIISFSSHNNYVRQDLLLFFLCYKKGNQGSEKLHYCPKSYKCTNVLS